jgi:hypothetical protein
MLWTIMMSTPTIETYDSKLLTALGELTPRNLRLLLFNRLLFNFTHFPGYNLLR